MAADAQVRGPPGWSWALVALLAIGLVVLGVHRSVWVLRGPHTGYVQLNLERIAAYQAHFGAERPAVVMLGNSTAKTALPDWSDADPDFVPILRIVDHRPYFDNFTALLPAIIEARPEAVILQASFLYAQPTTLVQWMRLRLALTQRVSDIETPEHIAYDNVCPTDVTSVYDLPERLKHHVDEHMSWHVVMTEHTLDGPVPRQARAFVEALDAAGIAVVLLSLPRSPALEAEEPHLPPALAEATRAMAAASPGIHALEVPALAPQFYCDDNHYTAEGRAKTVAWLMPRLVPILGQDG